MKPGAFFVNSLFTLALSPHFLNIQRGIANAFVQLDYFLEQTAFETCIDSLEQADSGTAGIQDGKVYSNEYASFIQIWSEGEVAAESVTMTEKLVEAFLFNACVVQPCFSSENCCSGSRQYISVHKGIKGEAELYKTCADVDSAIRSTLETSQLVENPNTNASENPSEIPTTVPSDVPSGEPSDQPMATPTGLPSQDPSGEPSAQPTGTPSKDPSQSPSDAPSYRPSVGPSVFPSSNPTLQPSIHPSEFPSTQPTEAPSIAPSKTLTFMPSDTPSEIPSLLPSELPSVLHSATPSGDPSDLLSSTPTVMASASPYLIPSTLPSFSPSFDPTGLPSGEPSGLPSLEATDFPSDIPSLFPAASPTTDPSTKPSVGPSEIPSQLPTQLPSLELTGLPSNVPSGVPSRIPTLVPSRLPSTVPSLSPTMTHTEAPSVLPSGVPSKLPSAFPSLDPTTAPSLDPSEKPSAGPSEIPSQLPTQLPSLESTGFPSDIPSGVPSGMPTLIPSGLPSTVPSLSPTMTHTEAPSVLPSGGSSKLPSTFPSLDPTTVPSLAPSKFGRLDIYVNYMIRTNGISGQDILTGKENNVASGLITATTTVLLIILDQGRAGSRRAKSDSFSGNDSTIIVASAHSSLEHLRGNKSTDSESYAATISSSRNLASYHEADPVAIVSAIDTVCINPPPQNENERCVLIRSIVTVFLDVNESEDGVRALITTGLRQSFSDGSFVAAIPPPPEPIPEGEKLEIKISYLIRTDGVSGQDILSGNGNNIASGLITATRTILLRVLEQDDIRGRSLLGGLPVSDPCKATGTVLNISSPALGIARLRKRRDIFAIAAPAIVSRHLATYHESAPVSIESATDIECTNPPALDENEFCILIRSAVTVFLEENDSQAIIRALIVDGIRKSFQDGSFLAEIPQ